MQICQVFQEYQIKTLNELAFCRFSKGKGEQVQVLFRGKKKEEEKKWNSKYQRTFPEGNINPCVKQTTCIQGHADT